MVTMNNNYSTVSELRGGGGGGGGAGLNVFICGLNNIKGD